MPAGTVVRPADVATRPHQSYSSASSSGDSRLNERTSWFSAKTAVWDPRILLQAIQAQDSEYTLRKAVEWGTKCNSDLSEEEKVDNVLRFLAHAIGLQTAISTDCSSLQSSISAHSRNDSTWSNVSTGSPQSDSASLLDFRCETPVICRPSPTPSIRSYCIADRDDDESDLRLSSTPSSIPDITSLPSSVCDSESDRDRAMEELREMVRHAIAIAEADQEAPLGLAELHAAAREITMARRAKERSRSPPVHSTPPRLSTPSKPNSKPVLSLDTSWGDSGTFTPLVRPTTFSRMSPQVLAHPEGQFPSTPRMKPKKLYKPRPASPNDPIPLQTFKTISSPSPDQCHSPTPLCLDNPTPESPTWSHGLLKNLRLDVHIFTDAISGLGMRKPASPKPPSPDPSSSDMSCPESPVDLIPDIRSNNTVSEWQYLRKQTDDTILATPIDEWCLPQLTPVMETDEWKS
ncbi:hypothetical protein RSOL_139850, partial [Rhizoctonia solani AG-3 Rhs1AP]